MKEPIKEKTDLSLSDLIRSQKVEDVADEKKSPLNQMKEFKERNPGLIVDTKDVKYDDEPKQFKNSIENDDRENEFNTYMDEMDDLIDTARNLQVTRVPRNQLEEAAMIDELDRIARNRSGKTIENPFNDRGEVMDIGKEEREGTSIALPQGLNSSGFFTERNTENEEDVSQKTEQGEDGEDDVSDNEHDKLVNILIDKTGFGTNQIDFTEDEKEKLTQATEIRVTEVENIEIGTIEFVTPNKSYVESIENEDMFIGTTLVPLVGSHSRAKMKGLGYGQLGDLIISQRTPTFEQYYKCYSTIYNNIVETTVGKFDSFEDFLKRTSFMDMNVLLYGLIVSTYPEVDSLGMRCSKCGKIYEQKYFVRELMDLKNASTEYLKNLDALMTTTPDQFKKYGDSSPVFKRKYWKLPYSGYILEFGIASAYDYLYKVLGNIMSEDFAEKFQDDVNGMMRMNSLYLGMIHSVSIPSGEKTAIKYDKFDDMIQILYRLPSEDIIIMTSILNKYNDAYQTQFTIKQAVCPACGNVVEYNPVDLNQLIFFKFQQLMSTGVNVENIPVL